MDNQKSPLTKRRTLFPLFGLLTLGLAFSNVTLRKPAFSSRFKKRYCGVERTDFAHSPISIIYSQNPETVDLSNDIHSTLEESTHHLDAKTSDSLTITHNFLISFPTFQKCIRKAILMGVYSNAKDSNPDTLSLFKDQILARDWPGEGLSTIELPVETKSKYFEIIDDPQNLIWWITAVIEVFKTDNHESANKVALIQWDSLLEEMAPKLEQNQNLTEPQRQEIRRLMDQMKKIKHKFHDGQDSNEFIRLQILYVFYKFTFLMVYESRLSASLVQAIRYISQLHEKKADLDRMVPAIGCLAAWGGLMPMHAENILCSVIDECQRAYKEKYEPESISDSAESLTHQNIWSIQLASPYIPLMLTADLYFPYQNVVPKRNSRSFRESLKFLRVKSVPERDSWPEDGFNTMAENTTSGPFLPRLKRAGSLASFFSGSSSWNPLLNLRNSRVMRSPSCRSRGGADENTPKHFLEVTQIHCPSSPASSSTSRSHDSVDSYSESVRPNSDNQDCNKSTSASVHTTSNNPDSEVPVLSLLPRRNGNDEHVDFPEPTKQISSFRHSRISNRFRFRLNPPNPLDLPDESVSDQNLVIKFWDGLEHLGVANYRPPKLLKWLSQWTSQLHCRVNASNASVVDLLTPLQLNFALGIAAGLQSMVYTGDVPKIDVIRGEPLTTAV